MKISNKESVQSVVALFKAKGIKHLVIAPGSRNAPLNISFNNDPYFKTYSLVDERSAAFFAMGMAQQLKAPVAVMCTSGSALLNFYPAVAEAFYQKIPLIVLSADRSEEWIDQADGQTIRQKGALDLHVAKSIHINAIEKSHFTQRKLNEVLNVALSEQMPVHINMAFDEPLYDVISKEEAIPVQNIAISKTITHLDHAEHADLLQQLKGYKRVLLLSGTNAPNEELSSLISAHVAQSKWVLLSETTSNLNVNTQIPCIDKVIFNLDTKELESLQPDLLITFGGAVVSKKVKQWMRGMETLEHWHVSETKAHLNTYLHLSRVIYARPEDFFREIMVEASETQAHYFNIWQDKYAQRRAKAKDFLNDLSFCDLKVYQSLFQHLPPNYMLQLGNSSVVRYAQLFEHQQKNAHFANRGTSGIDGSLSTAIGAACASADPVLCLIGDLSFFYDSNALWNKYIPAHFKVILMNNGGGDIFNIIPGPATFAQKDEYFVAQHQLTAEHHAKAFGLQYLKVNNENELEAVWDTFWKESHPVILEVNTQAIDNSSFLKGFWNSL